MSNLQATKVFHGLCVQVHEMGEDTVLSYVDKLSSIDPTQAILSLEDTLAIFQSVTHIVKVSVGQLQGHRVIVVMSSECVYVL